MGVRRKSILKGVLACALFVPVVMHQTVWTQAAVDVEAACYLTANSETDFQEDLAEYSVTIGETVTDKIVVDLYQVASITKDEHYDTFTYDLLEGYSLDGYDISTYDGLSKLDNEAWTAIGKQLFTEATEAVELEPLETVDFSEKSDRLSTGLYLMVVRNEAETDPDDYVDGDTTTAYTEQYVYTFTPQLVSLPSTNEDTSLEMKTSDKTSDEKWIYALEITLKAERERRLSSLRIEKLLEKYESSSPATFVFDIVAKIDDKTVYSNVTSLTFNEAGLDTAVLDGIPVGAAVTVTEVYSGASYKLTTNASADTKILIPADEGTELTAGNTATVRFGNQYNGKLPKGHAVKNVFTGSEDETWTWTKDGDTE